MHNTKNSCGLKKNHVDIPSKKKRKEKKTHVDKMHYRIKRLNQSK